MSLRDSFRQNWPTDFDIVKRNLISGFIIFLIALPLSIGISMASSAPPSAGILSAIVGGIVGAIVSGSYITISGPAAGLIVVILESINSLGVGDVQLGFKLTLFAIILAGLVQVALGLARLGTLGLAVPVNALHGLLASIGVIIMTKQIFLLGGIKAKSETTFEQIYEFFSRLAELNLEILMIGLLGLFLIILFSKIKVVSKIFPPALAAIIFGYVMSYMLDLEHEHVVDIFGTHPSVGPRFLLSVPSNINEYFNFPSFDVKDWGVFIKSSLTICFVASIESVLSTYAIDKLDPLKRSSNLNGDMISKGFCNIILGFIGGLPIISEIVRSSANVANGGTHRWSNFFHGIFILLFVMLAPQVLNHIPLAAFAAVLIFVGFRLANPSQLKSVYHNGPEQLAVFLITLIVTLSTDLLIGIFCGILVEFLLDLYFSKNVKDAFILNYSLKSVNDKETIMIFGPVTFFNMLKVKKLVESSKLKFVEIDLNRSSFVDYTAKVFLDNYSKSMQRKSVFLTGFAPPSIEH